MASGNFGGRKNELEETFFAQRDMALMQVLREQAATKERKQALADASGISDEDLIEQLDQLEVSGETLAAVSLVPLIAVAWADGVLDAKERQAVLDAAEQKGMDKEHPGYQLLQRWLAEKPDAKLLDVWKGYVAAIAPKLTDLARNALKEDLLGRARAVAEAAGGLLGLGSKVSKTEQAVLDELEQAIG